MNSEEKRAVIERYVQAYNAFDVEAMAALLHPDAEYLRITDGEVTARASGLQEFGTLAAEEGKQCSSRKLTVMQDYEKGGQVLLELKLTCVLAAEVAERLQGGETLTLEGVGEVTFHEEKIHRLTEILTVSRKVSETKGHES